MVISPSLKWRTSKPSDVLSMEYSTLCDLKCPNYHILWFGYEILTVKPSSVEHDGMNCNKYN